MITQVGSSRSYREGGLVEIGWLDWQGLGRGPLIPRTSEDGWRGLVP